MIDVEGHEVEVLEGAVNTLSITKRIIIEIELANREKVLKILNSFVSIKEEVESIQSNYLFLVREEDLQRGIERVLNRNHGPSIDS